MNLTNFSECIISHVALDFDKSFRNIFSLLLPAFRHDVFNPFNLNAKTSWEVKTRAKCTNRQRAYALFIMIFEAFNGAVSHSWAVIFQRGLFIVVLYIPSLNKLSIQPCKLVYRNHFFVWGGVSGSVVQNRDTNILLLVYIREKEAWGLDIDQRPWGLQAVLSLSSVFTIFFAFCFPTYIFVFLYFKSFYNSFHIFSFPFFLFSYFFHFYSFSVIFI